MSKKIEGSKAEWLDSDLNRLINVLERVLSLSQGLNEFDEIRVILREVMDKLCKQRASPVDQAAAEETLNRSGESQKGKEKEKLVLSGPDSPRENNSSVKKRRIVRRWSLLEEDALQTAVNKDGVGNWKAILTHNKDIFEGRTEVDLKDKWRNLNKKQAM